MACPLLWAAITTCKPCRFVASYDIRPGPENGAVPFSNKKVSKEVGKEGNISKEKQK